MIETNLVNENTQKVLDKFGIIVETAKVSNINFIDEKEEQAFKDSCKEDIILIFVPIEGTKYYGTQFSFTDVKFDNGVTGELTTFGKDVDDPEALYEFQQKFLNELFTELISNMKAFNEIDGKLETEVSPIPPVETNIFEIADAVLAEDDDEDDEDDNPNPSN